MTNKNTFLRFLTAASLLFLFCILVPSTLIAQRNGVNFRDDYSLEKAIQVAQIEDKNIFIDTYTPWCGPCKMMDIQFQEGELGKFFNKNYINIKINMDSEYGPAVKKKYDVFFLPTLLIVDKYGKTKYASQGLLTSDELLAYGQHFHDEIYNPVQLAESQEAKEVNVETLDTEKLNEIVVESKPKAVVQEEKPVEVVELPIEEKTETIINPNPSSISATVGKKEKEESQKVLFTQNDASKNPEFLYNLTYLHLQLQDGQQWACAERYLATQKDWNTRKNMSFIYDFVRSPGTKLFDHIVNNRGRYDILFGQENVSQSLAIMINMRLHQGYPRPSQEEALELFKMLDPEVAEVAAYNYFFERYEIEENYEAFVPLALKYLEEINPDDFSVINKVASYYENTTNNLSINQLIKMMEHAISVQGGSYYVLYDTLAGLYFKKGKKKKALESVERAMELAIASGVNTDDLIQLKSMILEL